MSMTKGTWRPMLGATCWVKFGEEPPGLKHGRVLRHPPPRSLSMYHVRAATPRPALGENAGWDKALRPTGKHSRGGRF
jgi:hypothetical protein